jgi:RNA polymerase sigma factor (sigma-70 family)
MVRVATADLISRARAGDGDAFRELTEPHRRELQLHCYRMLGSFQDAEDALQDTLLAAWQGLGGFEERASLRTWLYRIATNRCLNALRSASRRPAKAWDLPQVEPPEPTRLGEVVWLEPFPDALLEGAIAVPLGPEARYEQTESISLAFVTALQVLPPRQVAELFVDIIRNAGLESAGPLIVRRDETRNRGFDEGCLFGVEEKVSSRLYLRKRSRWPGSAGRRGLAGSLLRRRFVGS